MASEIMNTNGPGNSDTRYFPRWSVENPVEYHVQHTREAKSGTTKDLSCSGASIITDEIITPNQEITLVIRLSRANVVELRGEVVWVKPYDGKQQIGVNFSEVSNDAQELILKHAFEINKEKVLQHWYQGWDGQ